MAMAARAGEGSRRAAGRRQARAQPADARRQGRSTRWLTRATDKEREASKEILDAFFLGKAVAETVSERVGDAVGELLAEVARTDAERRRFIRELQEDVQARARAELVNTVEAAAPPPAPAPAPTPTPTPAAPADDLAAIAADARETLAASAGAAESESEAAAEDGKAP